MRTAKLLRLFFVRKQQNCKLTESTLAIPRVCMRSSKSTLYVTLLTLNCFFLRIFLRSFTSKKNIVQLTRARDSEREREREEGTRHVAQERVRESERGFLRGESFFFVYLTHFERGKSISFVLRSAERFACFAYHATDGRRAINFNRPSRLSVASERERESGCLYFRVVRCLYFFPPR